MNQTTQNTLLSTNKSNGVTETKKGEDDEDKQVLVETKDEVVSERKQKMFSRMTQEKTRTYMVYLLLLAVYVGIFRTADGFVFSSLYGETFMMTYLYQIMSARSQNDLLSQFYLREDLCGVTLSSDYDSIFIITLR